MSISKHKTNKKMDNLQQIPTSKLTDHPKNPRLIMREDVIDGIVANLNGEYPQKHALHVRPHGDGFEILSGHHRKRAAEKAGFESVWCWVEDMDDDTAFMELATSNNQGELSPLEIGMHALHYVDKSTGGRGNKGGLSAYAEKVGRPLPIITRNHQGAAVAGKVLSYDKGLDTNTLLTKAAHLAAIHKLPEETWQAAVEVMLKKGWSAAETNQQTREALLANTDKRKLAIFSGVTDARKLERIDDLRDRVERSLDYEETKREWVKWFTDADPLDIKTAQDKRIDLEQKESDRRDMEAEKEGQPEDLRPDLVVADPPWRYDFAETSNRQIENQYPTADVDEICTMAPDTQADAVIFLWATVAKLPEAFEVLEAWGFDYKTSAVWDKEKIGMGYWFRGQHELILVGTKGKYSPPEQSDRISSVFREPRGKHSKKPECFYKWVEQAFPHAQKLEMFCRSPRDGWRVFGNEATV